MRICLLIFVIFSQITCHVRGQADRGSRFERDVRPILADKCFHCHGPDESHREADLRLDDEASATADRGSYRVIAAGDPQQSELIARITSEDPDVRMPPADSKKPLTAGEIELLTRWVADGAPWSLHWAYVAPRQHAVPSVRDASWPRNWIDHFILARLEHEELRPSANADPLTLIRRLHFDLIGLPPEPEQVDDFLSNPSQDQYEELVDRLLESEHFGERMAIYWLDLVRYADSVGYHGDQTHSITPYRDYVIDAFNDDMPFDQFTQEQLAGDLLPDSTIDQKIASGYNRLLQTSHEGGVQAKEYLAIYAADRIRNLSSVWMSATLGCSQCHDHKYDPFTMNDFYALQAFFADIDEATHFKSGANQVVTRREPEMKVLSKRDRARLAEIVNQIAQLRQQLASLDAPSSSDTPVAPADPAGVESGRRALSGDDLQSQIAKLEKQRDNIQKNVRRTMITVSIEPRTIRRLPRGNWLDDSGPIMQPAVPETLGMLTVAGGRPNRLDLANWLTDPDAGVGSLMARVMANRLWYLFMGSGIAQSLDDFGGQGTPPEHPELLDNLAVEFVTSGWSMKHMMKQIVISRTYRQSSLVSPVMGERDPDNRWFARQSRYRLPAELVRDNTLAISGLLVREIGGPSVRPYQPAGYYRHLNFPTRTYQSHTNQQQWRRGVYMHWQRQFLHPMLKAFDAPSREECTAGRPRSNTPLAAMTLLNDPTFVEAARVFAQRILHDGGGTTDQRCDFAFRRAVSRQPTSEERKLLKQLLEANRQEYQSQPTTAEALVHVGMSPVAADLDTIELASWTAVARAILCLNEAMTRN